MAKRAVYGILLALLLPVAGYFILKGSTKEAVTMPRHFFPDSVVTTTKNGKTISDTAWHTLPDFQLKNQLGKDVSWKDLQIKNDDNTTEGKIVVANFFFTNCPTICPTLTIAMRDLQQGIKRPEKVGNRDADFIHFLSFSIDPARDSVPRLKSWADRFGVNPQNWWLLTGDRKQIYNLSYNEMKLMMVDGGNVDSNFIHTDMFVLIDKYRTVRGYYHMLKFEGRNKWTIDTAALSALSKDIILLTLEKDRKKKSFLSGKLELLAVVFTLAAALIILLFVYLKKENRRL
jgi:protein SCO1/2